MIKTQAVPAMSYLRRGHGPSRASRKPSSAYVHVACLMTLLGQVDAHYSLPPGAWDLVFRQTVVHGTGWCCVGVWGTVSFRSVIRRLDSEVPIGDLTRDLQARARDMERAKYLDVEATRPAPLRVLGKRGAGEGRGDFFI